MIKIVLEKDMSKSWEERWETYNQSDLIRHNALLRNIFSLFKGNLKNTKILEVGAVTGIDIIHLAKNSAISYALDYSRNSIKIIKRLSEKNKIKVNIVNADAENIPFEDNSFDIIYSQGVIEHYENPRRIISEQIRLLKKGGYLIIDVPQKFSLYTIKKKLLKFLGKWFEVELEYSVRDMKNLAKQYGLKLIKIYGWGFYPYRFWNIMLPSTMGDIYKKLQQKIEHSKFSPHVSQCIGGIYQK